MVFNFALGVLLPPAEKVLVDVRVEESLLTELVLSDADKVLPLTAEGRVVVVVAAAATGSLLPERTLLEDVFRMLLATDDGFLVDAAILVTVKVAVDDLTVEVVVVSEMLMQEHADEKPDAEEQITVGPELNAVELILDTPLLHRLS